MFAASAAFEGLICAYLVAEVVLFALFGNELFAELVVQAFLGKVAFLFRHPFLKAHMRTDDELGHETSLPLCILMHRGPIGCCVGGR